MGTISLKVSRLTYERSIAIPREIRRLFALPDRWLAEELLRLVRTIREREDRYPDDAARNTYNAVVLWDVIPEVARRLGGKLRLNESANQTLRAAQGMEFRRFVASCMHHVQLSYLDKADIGEVKDPVDILFHSVYSGNPVAFAMDRFVPPTLESDDLFSKQLRHTAAARELAPTSVWTPAYDDYPRGGLIELVPEDDDPAPEHEAEEEAVLAFR